MFVALYFLFFYPQAFIALHHFVPVMILPLVVAWRVALLDDLRWAAPAAGLPAPRPWYYRFLQAFRVDRTTRAIGMATEVRVGDMNGDWAAYREALSARRGVRALFHVEWEVADPARERVGEPLGVVYYGTRWPRTAADTVQYVIQRTEESPPSGFTPVAIDSTLSVFVRDSTRWARDRFTPPSTDFRAPIYAIPRTTLHYFLGIPAHAFQLDLATLPGMSRFFH